jgi:hypothetical protein
MGGWHNAEHEEKTRGGVVKQEGQRGYKRKGAQRLQ